MLSDDNSVCDSGLACGGCENFVASRTLPLIAANLGSKDLQSEVTVVAAKNSKREACPGARRSGSASWKWERKDEETGVTWRYKL